MRPGIFFMGRALTRRHLNASRSPLLTGYVRPTATSCTVRGMTMSPLSVNALLGSAASSGSPLPLEVVFDGALNYSIATLLSQGLSAAVLSNFSCLQNISTCVMKCERVFGAGDVIDVIVVRRDMRDEA